jgi:glycerophosphoryl diester phosphodiesterase
MKMPSRRMLEELCVVPVVVLVAGSCFLLSRLSSDGQTSANAAVAPPHGSRAVVRTLEPGALVIAHRGASAVAPENTIPAMRSAVRAGADMVEFDVQRTADGRLVVMHDTTFARTTDVGTSFPGRQGDPIGSFTWAEVRELDAGSWFSARYSGTRPPSLEALLRVLRPEHIGLLLELKNPQLYVGYEGAVAAALRHQGYIAGHRVWVHSFDSAALEAFHDVAPSVPVGLISKSGTPPASDVPWLSTLNITNSSVTRAVVTAAAREGLPVLAWPASGRPDNAGQIERLVDDGTAGIITDRPAAALKALGHEGCAPRSYDPPARSPIRPHRACCWRSDRQPALTRDNVRPIGWIPMAGAPMSSTLAGWNAFHEGAHCHSNAIEPWCCRLVVFGAATVSVLPPGSSAPPRHAADRAGRSDRTSTRGPRGELGSAGRRARR